MARLREAREIRRARFRYWRAPVRMCQGEAIALVEMVDRPGEELEICAAHLARELETPERIVWFEEIHISRQVKAKRDRATVLELADSLCMNRAPTERSWESLDTRDRKRRDKTA